MDQGRPQGGFKSDAARAAYWRMQWESAIGALADLIAENTQNVEFARDFYANNYDLLDDRWRLEFIRHFPSVERTCWCGSAIGFREDKGFIDCLANKTHDWRGKDGQ